MTKDELIAFEDNIAQEYAQGKIRGPTHLSGGNEDHLIDIFRHISREDWVFSTWRNHYHALLHGIPPDLLKKEIMAGRSMSFSSAKHRFFTSAIVGGILPIAVGVADALKRQNSMQKVWCFVGDMTSETGIFHEATNYAYCQGLPIAFFIEDNGLSCESPTLDCWGPLCPPETGNPLVTRFEYKLNGPHVGIGRRVFSDHPPYDPIVDGNSPFAVNHQWLK